MGLILLSESIRNLVTKLGYIYRPAIMPPSKRDRDRLRGAGADEVLVDLSDRQEYLRLVQRVGAADLQSSLQTLLLLTLADLGDTVPKVEQQLNFWLQHEVTIEVVSEECPLLLQELDAVAPVLTRLAQDLKGRHIAEGHAHNRLNRKPPPGPAPFGYRRVHNTYVLEEQQATVVRAFFDRFLLYGSIRGSVKYVQEERGETISVTTARRWLTSPVYRGDLQFKDGVTLRDTHPPLLSREEAAQIDRWARRNSPISSRSTSAPRALAGLVHCQTCDRPLRIVQATRKYSQRVYRYLRCPGCRYSVKYNGVLQNTIQAVCQQLPAKAANLNSVPLDSIKSRIELQIEHNKGKISDLSIKDLSNEADSSGKTDRQYQRYQLEGENSKLNQKRDQLPPADLAAIAQTVSIEPFWQSLSESEQRSYLREFIRKITVNSHCEVKLEFFF